MSGVNAYSESKVGTGQNAYELATQIACEACSMTQVLSSSLGDKCAQLQDGITLGTITSPASTGKVASEVESKSR